MVEADGSLRVVDYTADSKNGFNAVVKHKGKSHHSVGEASSHSEINLKPGKPEIKQASASYLYPQDVEQSYSEPKVTTHFESSSGVISKPTASLVKDDYPQQYSTSTESNQLPPIKTTYVYVPKEEIAPSKSPKETVKYRTHSYIPQYSSDIKQTEDFHSLPVDLSLLKQDSSEELFPLDVSLIKPIEIDLSKSANYNAISQKIVQSGGSFISQGIPKNHAPEPIKELSQEQLAKYLTEYYKTAGEDEFRPITQKTPQTYRSGKKPVTTPGLKNYSSQSDYSSYSRQKTDGYDRISSGEPVAFPANNEDSSAAPETKKPAKRVVRNRQGNRRVVYKRTTTYANTDDK